MKAKFLALAALVLGLASCQTDTVNGVKVDANGEAPVTIQVGLLEEATRAVDSGIGAIGNVNMDEYDIRFILEVYDQNDVLAKERQVVSGNDTSASFTLRLVPGRDYKFVAWADFVLEGSKDDLHYNTNKNAGGLKKNITLLGDHNAMDETRDAYTQMFYVEKFDSKSTIKMTLTRPFAKLRIVTTDMKELYSDLTSATVEYTVPLYTSFNALAETAGPEVEDITKTVTYGAATTYTNENPTQDGKMTLYADYFFGAADNKVRFTMDVTDKTGIEIPQIVFNTDIPVQRNHLTTIYGPVLTDANNVTVEIKSDFAQPGINVDMVEIETAADLAAALTANKENIYVILGNDIDLPISSLGQQTGGSGEYKLGGEDTKNITIDLNGFKLNITTNYWSGIGVKNDDARILIQDGTMTSSQATGTWNSYDVTFANCNYAIENVVFEKAIAFTNANKVVELKNVTIKESHDYYAMWISAEGQTVNIDGLTIESEGRGIKIDEEYLAASEVAKVTLNINNAKFTTKKKAAIMVKSVAGADITLSDIDITGVAGDSSNEVWIDEDAKNYAGMVSVAGGSAIVEGATVVDGTQASFAEAVTTENATVQLPAGRYTMPKNIAKNVTIICAEGTTFEGASSLDINGATVVGATFENLAGSAVSSTINGTLKDCTFRGSNALRWCYAGETVVFENCVFDGNTYGVHFDGGANDATFKNCTFSGFNAFGAAITQLTLEGCTFVGNGKSSYNGANLWGSTTLKNCEFTFNGSSQYEWIDCAGDNTASLHGCTINGEPLTVGDIDTLTSDSSAFTLSDANGRVILDANAQYTYTEDSATVTAFKDGAVVNRYILSDNTASYVKSISVGEGIVRLKDRCFCKNTNLESVTLPNSLTDIEEGAFQGSAIKSITIPENVAVLGKQSIGYCPELETIVIKAKDVTIDNYVARGCAKLKSVYIYSENVEFINKSMYFTNKENADASAITFYVSSQAVADKVYDAQSTSHSYGIKIVSIDGATTYYNTLK